MMFSLTDPNAMKNSESSQDVSSKPTTVFSMPLLPQTSSENSSNDKQAVLEAEGVSVSRTLGYKGLLEETDDDDKVWDSFSTTIEAVMMHSGAMYATHMHISTCSYIFLYSCSVLCCICVCVYPDTGEAATGRSSGWEIIRRCEAEKSSGFGLANVCNDGYWR